jgi:hypothetical protein
MRLLNVEYWVLGDGLYLRLGVLAVSDFAGFTPLNMAHFGTLLGLTRALIGMLHFVSFCYICQIVAKLVGGGR